MAAAPNPGGLGRGTQPSLAGSAAGVRTGTLVFGDQAGSPVPPVAHAAPPRPMAHAPAPTMAAATHDRGGDAIGAAVNGQLAGKLGQLGLSPQQADAVLALSRDVVERIVWEVVPQLAETMIKEEIQRLMKA